jgi:hypothetical protein
VSTPRQIAANRRNAQKSTGPKTEQGKQASSRNSLKHGLLARVVPQETEGWQELITGLYESLRPQDELQRFLVDQIAHCMIRLQRSAACEQRWLGTSRPASLPSGLAYAGEEPPAASVAARLDEFLRAEHCRTLLRYEAACNRQIRRNLELLLKLQAALTTRKPACPYLTEPESAPPLSEAVDRDTTRRAGPTCPAGQAPAGDFATCASHTPQPGHLWPGDQTGTKIHEGPPQLASFRNDSFYNGNDKNGG